MAILVGDVVRTGRVIDEGKCSWGTFWRAIGNWGTTVVGECSIPSSA